MATQNLFEKYGIKDVADVTFYRIERKEETYESQRNISVKSILKGAVELRTVYPMEDGVSVDDGFNAYVFTDASIITGINYDCDDKVSTKVTFSGSFEVTEEDVPVDDNGIEPGEPAEVKFDVTISNLEKDVIDGFIGDDDDNVTTSNYTSSVIVRNIITKRQYTLENLIENHYEVDGEPKLEIIYTKSAPITSPNEGEETNTLTYIVNFIGTAEVDFVINADLATGVYNETGRKESDLEKALGTHEYTYAEQAFMLFAKRQNLVGKTGARYRFLDVDNIMGNLVFEDAYTLSPNSSERVVVLGLADSFVNEDVALPETASWSSINYEVEQIDCVLKDMETVFHTKAYDVTYNDYAEIVVEDEMGYFNPKFLGTKYDKITKKVMGDFSKTYTAGNFKNGIDRVLANAKMWGENEHYSINDAIAALRQQQKILDAEDSAGVVGIKELYGGYRVTGDKIPERNAADTDDKNAIYKYTIGGEEIDAKINSTYALSSVLDALAELAYAEGAIDKVVEVDYNEDKESNRAIYVDVAGANASAKSFIYLLHNKNYRRLGADKDGVFTFRDRNGNKLYYQDKIFAGTEWLALIVIGTKGLIFVVNRHGTVTNDKVAWMVSQNGFISDKQAGVCVKNGLIHTVDITTNDETFEAVCSVKNMKVRKTKKTVNRYVPVLFLDTLKISTIEQTAEEVYATGGRSNANLIGWDYGKEITLALQDALFTPASMSATFGSYEGSDFRNGVKDVTSIDRTEKCIAKRSFIVPAGNQNGTPSEADRSAQAVYLDPNTMDPYQDGTPIAEGETFLKWTRSIAYDGNSLGHMIEISADKFPGTYKIVGDTYVRSKETGEDQRFQFIIPQAKMGAEQSITLEADGDPVVFDMNMTVLRPDDGVMVRFVQYDVVENEEENDGSHMVKGTENLNLLDDAELYKVDSLTEDDETFIGATEY